MYNCGREGDNFILSNIPYLKVFHIPNVVTSIHSVKEIFHYNLREQEISVDMVTELKHNPLMIARKFVDAKYITI